MLYILICLCLSLAGFAAFQLLYLLHLGTLNLERKKKILELERRTKNLLRRLEGAELEIAKKDKFLESFLLENEDEEAWADVIDER